MKKILLGLINSTFLLAIMLFINSCCDCPLKETTINIKCNVREVSITDFDPSRVFNQADNTYVPSRTYSIHSFLFPNDFSSSGSLPNDERFRTLSTLSIIRIPFSDGRPYFLTIFDDLPLNSDQNGDILVDSVYIDPVSFLNNYAYIRVKGFIEKLNSQFLLDDANAFCKFIEDKQVQNEIQQKFQTTKLYGLGLSFAEVLRKYNQNSIKVVDAQNNEVLNIVPGLNDIQKVLDIFNKDGIDLKVKMGDVFVYRAINMRKFVFAVVNIGTGQLDPFKKRVTIMFTQVN